MSKQMKTAIKEVKEMSCSAQCLTIIAANSAIFESNPDKFWIEVGKVNARLRDVLISSSAADRKVRVQINRSVGSSHSPGSFSNSTRIRWIILNSCT